MVTVCDDGCEDETLTDTYEWVMTDADEHHAETCSPFCGCSCCQSLSLGNSSIQLLSINVYNPAHAISASDIPEDPGHPIWQPPKILS